MVLLVVVAFTALGISAQTLQRQRLGAGSVEAFTKQRDGFVCLLHLLVLDESGTLYVTDNGCAALAPIPFSVSKEDAKFFKAMANARQQIDSWRQLELHDPNKASTHFSETVADEFRAEDRTSFCKTHPDWFVLDLHRDPADDTLKRCVSLK
jgi:hypothetical protein